MKLVSIEIDGYRRFRTKQELKLDGRLVAILGPNEAGKTSILRLLQSLNDASAFATVGGTQDTSRGQEYEPGHRVISARFLLEPSDFTAIAEIPASDHLKWLLLEKRVNGTRNLRFEPPVTRNVKRRRQVLQSLQALAETDEASSEDPLAPLAPDTQAYARSVLNLIPDAETNNLSKEALDGLRSLRDLLAPLVEESIAGFVKELSSLIYDEEQQDLRKRIEQVLVDRLPRFIPFSVLDRDLKSNYDLNSFFAQNPPASIPRALQNLTSAASLNLNELFATSQTGDEGKIETLISTANESLKETMSSAWSQSSVHVRFRLSGGQLSILVGSQKHGFESISERSDGLRQFVAMMAFLMRTGESNKDIVLLVDEAEMHLHYDAQADLVQMLAKQELARKVIYTTHSIGCLPEDLGSGIRLVQPSSEKESTVVNTFWSQGGIGLSPVLVGMGAATMAFLPVRFCVLTEGPTDMLLIPALLKEALGVETLGFQISPGLSQAGDAQIPIIQSQGHRVAFLLDGDEGGNSIATKLKRANVPEKKIVRLDQVTGEECVVEDFVASPVYASAINEEFLRSGSPFRISSGELPKTIRPAALDRWCEQRGIRIPHKVPIAYHVRDRIYDGPIVEPERAQQLCELHDKIRVALDS